MAEPFKVLVLNAVSANGLARLPANRYTTAKDVAEPDAILLRSADLHAAPIARSVLAIGRAGAGTNNIPVAAMSQRGVPVFNTPGANANAVKELVLAGMLIAARNIAPALRVVAALDAGAPDMDKTVENGKKAFAGHELAGQTLGIIGLGKIGCLVADAAIKLGMKVLGYDPQITVQRAWQLSSSVEQALSLDDLFARADIITVHVPLMDQTRGLVSAARLALMRKGGVVLNFARAPIVDDQAVLASLDAGHLHGYVCDFPKNGLKDHPKVVTLPHLGASTGEAEENCAVMAAETVREFLENGNLRNCVNFPEAVLARVPGTARLAIANSNVPNMVGQISTCLAEAKLNIADLLNKSRGEYAYTLIDADGGIPAAVVEKIRSIEGVLSARVV